MLKTFPAGKVRAAASLAMLAAVAPFNGLLIMAPFSKVLLQSLWGLLHPVLQHCLRWHQVGRRWALGKGLAVSLWPLASSKEPFWHCQVGSPVKHPHGWHRWHIRYAVGPRCALHPMVTVFLRFSAALSRMLAVRPRRGSLGQSYTPRLDIGSRSVMVAALTSRRRQAAHMLAVTFAFLCHQINVKPICLCPSCHPAPEVLQDPSWFFSQNGPAEKSVRTTEFYSLGLAITSWPREEGCKISVRFGGGGGGGG